MSNLMYPIANWPVCLSGWLLPEHADELPGHPCNNHTSPRWFWRSLEWAAVLSAGGHRSSLAHYQTWKIRKYALEFDVIILTPVSSLHSCDRVCSIVFAQHAHNMTEHGVTDRSLSFPSYLISNVMSVKNKIQCKVTKRGWHSYLHLCPHIGRRSRRLFPLCVPACHAAGLVSFGASKKFHTQLSPQSKKHKTHTPQNLTVPLQIIPFLFFKWKHMQAGPHTSICKLMHRASTRAHNLAPVCYLFDMAYGRRIPRACHPHTLQSASKHINTADT